MKMDSNKMDSNVITILTKLKGHIWKEAWGNKTQNVYSNWKEKLRQ
jgi:hypothetical protein